MPAMRQVREVAAQAHRIARPDGFFGTFAEQAKAGDDELAEPLRRELERAAAGAASAYGTLAAFLESELEPAAAEHDAVGRDLYALQSRHFLGAIIDLDETYEWGIEELARMVAEQESIAREIMPGASVDEAIAFLDDDPSRKLHGTDALQRWMQETSDRAVAELGATQFDIPDEIRTLECLIAPTQEGGIYYTGPSDDFSRPGRMWWSVPEGVTEFDTWRELTTVYHEGVPGHHLQIGQAVVNRGKLNTWRRQLAGTSGHAEGWALYAERLMEELGYLDDPGRPSRHARRPADARGPRRARHRRAPRQAAPRRQRARGRGSTRSSSWRKREHERGVRALRGQPVPRLARARRRRTRSGSASGSSCATRSRAARAARSTSASSTAGARPRRRRPRHAARALLT